MKRLALLAYIATVVVVLLIARDAPQEPPPAPDPTVSPACDGVTCVTPLLCPDEDTEPHWHTHWDGIVHVDHRPGGRREELTRPDR